MANAKDSTSPSEAPHRHASQGGDRFRGFDGLRGIAILSVIVYHGVLASRYPHTFLGPLRPLLLAGWTGVDLFFALSGFLITSLLLREEERERCAGRPAGFSLWRFYVRRALRILPAFYAVFLVEVFVLSRFAGLPSTKLAGVRESPLGLFPFAAFFANYVIAYGPRWFGASHVSVGGAFDVFWSLCVEEHFYLLWPLFLLLVKSTRHRLLGALTVGLALPILRFVVTSQGWDRPLAVHYASHYRIDSILWGGTAAIVASKLKLSDGAQRLLIAAGGLSILALIFTDTMAVLPVGRPLGFSVGFTLLALTSSLILVELVRKPHTRLARLLEFRPLSAVGKVSYGMYLLHLPMIDVGMLLLFAVPRPPTATNLILALALFVVLTYAAAWLLYQLVERWFLALRSRLRP